MGNNNSDFSGSKNPNYRSGYCVSGCDKKFYNSWTNMKQRCLNPNNPKYPRYGGRGINICDDWLTIQGFVKWAESSGYIKGLTIDRINNDGNYEPNNCHWINAESNSRKKKTTKISFLQAEEIRIRLENGEDERELAREFGVVHGTIWFIKRKFTHVADGECSKMLKTRDKINHQNA